MTQPKHIRITDFDYELPEERIAKYPLQERDASKLLFYQNGEIADHGFRDLPGLLPEHSLLVFNDTKVIRARLLFDTPGGARVEVFLLEPLTPADYQLNLSSENTVEWKCMVGNLKRWKESDLKLSFKVDGELHTLKATKLDRLEGMVQVRFSWETAISFADILYQAGELPIPPYLNRKTEETDLERYQTVYSAIKGSVAAPTAGLHFTDRVFEDLEKRGTEKAFVTLHVGAGTFRPVKSEELEGHEMHEERIIVKREVVQNLLHHKLQGGKIIAVGTTSVRLLESLFWFVACHEGSEIKVEQWDPYEKDLEQFSAEEVFRSLLQRMDEAGTDFLEGSTGILIAPGYTFRIIDGLITNFHQPKSTLLLLISALVGEDWRKIYSHALTNDYRFLSYGDSSLLMN